MQLLWNDIGKRRLSIRIVISLAVASTALLAAGCQKKEKIGEPITLKIGGMWSAIFDNFYESLLTEKFPYIQFEVVDDIGGMDLNEIKNVINKEQPDIIVSTRYNYELVVQSGLADSLDSLVESDRKELGDVNSNFIQRLRNYTEDHQIYGWPLSFNSNALFYNKTLFDQYNVDYPHDGQTWGDTLELAQRFAGDGDSAAERIYGLSRLRPFEPEEKVFSIIDSAGITEQLSISNGSDSVTLNTEPWRTIWTAVTEAYRTGAIGSGPLQKSKSLPEGAEGITNDQVYADFLQGKAAMIEGGLDLIPMLQQNEAKFEWGVTSTPGAYADPEVGELYSINRSSAHKEAAWQVIKFLTSDELVKKAMAQSLAGVALPLHVSLAEDHYGMDLSVFYEKEPVKFDGWDPAVDDEQFQSVYYKEALQQIRGILAGEKNVDQALSDLQELLIPARKQNHNMKEEGQ